MDLCLPTVSDKWSSHVHIHSSVTNVGADIVCGVMTFLADGDHFLSFFPPNQINASSEFSKTIVQVILIFSQAFVISIFASFTATEVNFSLLCFVCF